MNVRLQAKLLLTLLVLIPSVSSPGVSQGLRSGTIRGVVRDTSGAPVSDALVALSANGPVARSARDGEFVLPMIAAGAYEMRLESFGYRPLLVTGVVVPSGGEAVIDVSVRQLSGNVVSVDTLPFARVGVTTRASARVEISGEDWRSGAGRRETIGDVADRLGLPGGHTVDGLPQRSGSVWVDGVRYPIDPDPLGRFEEIALPIPRLALATAALETSEMDVAVASPAGTTWSILSIPAPDALRVESSLAAGRGVESAADGTSPGFEGSFLLGGPVSGQASALVALEGSVGERLLLSPSASSSPWAEVAVVATDTFGVEVSAAEPLDLRTTSMSALAGVDWRQGQNSLQVRTRIATRSPTDDNGFSWARESRAAEALSAGIAAVLETDPGDIWTNSLRVGADVSQRSYEPAVATSAGADVAPGSTSVLGLGLSLGANPRLPREFSRSTASVLDVFELRAESHRFSLGAGGTYTRYSLEPASESASEFVFGSVDDFANQKGSFTELVLSRGSRDISIGELAAFAQDSWRPTPAVELVFGVRGEVELRRGPVIDPDPAWFLASGFTDVDLPESEIRLLPRLRATIDLGPGGWRFDAGAGLFGESIDPLLLDELYTELGTTRVRRGVGSFTGWPAAPDTLQVPFVGRRLTLADPSLASPRTLRANAGLTGSLGTGSTISLTVGYRWTDRLARRVDLNRLAEPLGEDQHGRPLFGVLTQAGSVVRAAASSSRRFAEFDEVSLVRSDGESGYLGVTGRVEQTVGEGFRLFASYTFSRTRDNWPVGGRDGEASTAPSIPDLGEGGAWVSGRSDYDIPHRGSAGGELTLPLGGLRIGALYRFHSGRPFTPTFQPGVDVNGDNDTTNDPAFLDRGIDGYGEVASGWSCLSAGDGYAARNSCRTPSVSALDLRLGLPIRRFGELYVDVFDLVGGSEVVPDRALYLIDPDTALASNAGVTTLPLIVNPDFGQPLLERVNPRTLRIGLDLSF